MGKTQSPGTEISLHALETPGVRISATQNGAIHAIESGDILINQVLGSAFGGGLQRIFLRIHNAGRIRWEEIVGSNSNGQFELRDGRLLWSGQAGGLNYRCAAEIHPKGDTWVYSVEIDHSTSAGVTCDVIMLQDIALATRGQTRNNELFTSQYLDHFAARDERAGFVVMSRQNLPQTDGKHPWLMQGCLPNAAGFTTDGLDFFGPKYKASAAPAAMSKRCIGESVRQYEMAYVAVQGALIDLRRAQSHRWDFFFHYVSDHPSASCQSDLDRMKTVRARLDGMQFNQAMGSASAAPARSLLHGCELWPIEELTSKEIAELWPGAQRHAEIVDGQLHSFFHGDDARHVVFAAKEKLSARPHGHILRAGKGLTPDSNILSSTCYAHGVFASQLAMGNTSLAILFSRIRDPLNILRSSGMRIFVRETSGNPWRLLGVPSAFEMALGECRWIYKHGQELLTVRCRASENDAALAFDVVTAGKPVQLLICGEVAAGSAEFESKPVIEIVQFIEVRPNPQSMLAAKQPGLRFRIVTPDLEGVESIRDQPPFASGSASDWPCVVIQTNAVTSFRWTVLGAMTETDATSLTATYAARPVEQNAFWAKMTGATRLECPVSADCQRIQDALTWFARDAVVHLATPRGLEQASGGAWGVRDVCQGPVEFLLSYGHRGTVAEILRIVFSQQYEGRWDWPQWFMFPPFEAIQSPHCHGDVIVWPLKALCDYLEESNDFSILKESLPYTDAATFQPTSLAQTMIEHVDRLIEKIQSDFIPGTALPRYGEGDWDDSLQPADASLRHRMVSSWTTELTFEQLRRYAEAMKRFGDEERAERATRMADAMAADFHRHLLPQGIVAGFAVFGEQGSSPVEYLLHPSDQRTGLRYRLIPMTRGIISGIFSGSQASAHLSLIEQHLLYPDGARLMDRPTTYRGGVEQTFRRSESAAFFGREIGLQYVHAHLRYAQALARMGRADELLRALMVVNPIAVTELVPGARPRQRNCYFSSSDAAFADRYQASTKYQMLRDGTVATDGGWRVYSSGPGIYTNLVIRHLLGLRRYYDCYEFDPVLPADFNGASCEMTVDGRQIRYEFSVGAGRCGPQGISINGRDVPNARRVGHPYRLGGLRVTTSDFDALLRPGENIVRIEL